jgi:replicative DNA helicase
LARETKPEGAAPRAIPVDPGAERAVVGAILLDPDSLFKIQDRFKPHFLDDERLRIVYEACEALVEKRQGITLITLRHHLEEHGLLDRVGGVAFLAELAAATPTAAHIEHHGTVVREKALARSLIRGCESIASRGYDGTIPVEDLLEEAEREVMQLAMGHVEAGFVAIKGELEKTFDHIERIQAGTVSGLQMGFEDFDRLTGGLSGGDLVIVAARPSMGKTALALNMARNCAVDGGGCAAVFSLEMTALQLTLRLLAADAEVDLQKIRDGFLGDRDWRKLTRAASVLQEAPIFIDDGGVVTATDVSAKARRLHRERPLSVIVVDYIQLMQTRVRGDRREQEIAETTRALKLLAKDLNVPVIALSQLNRGPELRPNKRPVLADLRESGAIEQDADLVLFIYREEVYDRDTLDHGIAELHIAKQRNGPTGMIKLQFEAQYTRFSNLAGAEPGPPTDGFGDPGGGLEPAFE